MSWDGKLKVVFFDVGQGDSIFVETPGGHQILIDGGPDGRVVLEKLGKETPFWDRTLDLVILTHPEYDHLRGLIDVLARYKVENILWTGEKKKNVTFEKWLAVLGEENGNIVVAQRGGEIKAGNLEIFVLYPLEKIEGIVSEKSSNDNSIVVQLVFGETSFLLFGDISKKIENKMLKSKDIALDLDVLKVAHHGSKTSTSKEFLEKVTPEIAVISVGKDNQYGHPHQEVLSNLAEFGIKVLRTDEKGDIKIVSDGNTIRLNQY